MGGAFSDETAGRAGWSSIRILLTSSSRRGPLCSPLPSPDAYFPLIASDENNDPAAGHSPGSAGPSCARLCSRRFYTCRSSSGDGIGTAISKGRAVDWQRRHQVFRQHQSDLLEHQQRQQVAG
jgi:hypothetical protein